MSNPAYEDIAVGASLQDDFLRDFMSAGVYDFASDIGIIQDGQIPAVKAHEQGLPSTQWQGNPTGTMPMVQAGAPIYMGNQHIPQHVHGAVPTLVEGNILRSSQQAMPMTPAPKTIPTASMPSHSRFQTPAEKVVEDKSEGFQIKKKKKGAKGNAPDKGGKGLRHFSMKVCAKVESKGRTTYNEVADELVAELSKVENGGSPDTTYDEKNIRRRVYDALNVLMAMDIISKSQKKEITWRGLPTTKESNYEHLKEDKKRLSGQIEKKQVYLKELIEQKKALEALIERNQVAIKREKDVSQSGVELPFLVVQTRPDAKVDVQLSDDKQLVSFDFTYNPFEIHDENYVLQNMVLAGKLKVKQEENSAS